MRIFGKSWSDIKDAATYQGPKQSGWLGTAQSLSNAPGSLGSLMKGLSAWKWNSPFGSQANSADMFAGGFSSRYPWARSIGRAVGSYYAGGSIGRLFGGSGVSGGYGGQLGKAAPGIYHGLQGAQGQQGAQQPQGVQDGTNTGGGSMNFGLGSLFGGGGAGGGGGGGSGGAGLFGGGMGGDLLGIGSQLFMGNRFAQGQRDISNRAIQVGAPLENVQRQPYQGQLLNLTQHPEQFMETDPYIQASKKAIADQTQSIAAKSGNYNLAGIQGAGMLQQAIAQAYNDRIRQLLTAGGFDQGPGYAATVMSQLLGTGNIARMGAGTTAMGGLSNLFGGGSQVGGGSIWSKLGGMFNSGGGGSYTGGSGANTGFDMSGGGGGMFDLADSGAGATDIYSGLME